MTSTFPTVGNITDMEAMTLKGKLDFLRAHKTWKCKNKTEVLAEHETTWTTNGLVGLRYQEIACELLNGHCVKVTVDVQVNNHWTDQVCRLEDTQLDQTIDEIKTKFANKTR